MDQEKVIVIDFGGQYNQLVVLTTEVNDNNFLLIHDQSPILCIYIYIIVKLATYDKP